MVDKKDIQTIYDELNILDKEYRESGKTCNKCIWHEQYKTEFYCCNKQSAYYEEITKLEYGCHNFKINVRED